MRSILSGVILSALAVTAGHAAGPVDPDWPCVQRRQPALSVGQIWGGPPPDDAAQAHVEDPDVQQLAQVIALRRTPLPEAEGLVRDFAGAHDASALVGLFLAAFDHIQHQRNRVMEGITRYAHKQEALDQEINALRHAFDTANSTEPKDFDRLDALETQIDWATRVFRDRQQSLTYVCETPVILEQRAFALGRLIAARLAE